VAAQATPKWKTATLILENGRPLAHLDAPLWPVVGALVDFADHRPARIRAVRLRLESSTATVVVDVESQPN